MMSFGVCFLKWDCVCSVHIKFQQFKNSLTKLNSNTLFHTCIQAWCWLLDKIAFIVIAQSPVQCKVQYYTNFKIFICHHGLPGFFSWLFIQKTQ